MTVVAPELDRFAEVPAIAAFFNQRIEGRSLATWIEREVIVEAVRYATSLPDLLAAVCYPGGDEGLVDEAVEAGQAAVDAALQVEEASGRSVFLQARRLFRVAAAAIDEVYQDAIAVWVAEVCQEAA